MIIAGGAMNQYRIAVAVIIAVMDQPGMA